VENALVHIIAQKKNLSLDGAKEQLQLLREADRIHMDVY
jgi:sulfite reductase alpha subunit-like flavoprotein